MDSSSSSSLSLSSFSPSMRGIVWVELFVSLLSGWKFIIRLREPSPSSSLSSPPPPSSLSSLTILSLKRSLPFPVIGSHIFWLGVELSDTVKLSALEKEQRELLFLSKHNNNNTTNNKSRPEKRKRTKIEGGVGGVGENSAHTNTNGNNDRQLKDLRAQAAHLESKLRRLERYRLLLNERDAERERRAGSGGTGAGTGNNNNNNNNGISVAKDSLKAETEILESELAAIKRKIDSIVNESTPINIPTVVVYWSEAEWKSKKESRTAEDEQDHNRAAAMMKNLLNTINRIVAVSRSRYPTGGVDCGVTKNSGDNLLKEWTLGDFSDSRLSIIRERIIFRLGDTIDFMSIKTAQVAADGRILLALDSADEASIKEKEKERERNKERDRFRHRALSSRARRGADSPSFDAFLALNSSSHSSSSSASSLIAALSSFRSDVGGSDETRTRRIGRERFEEIRRRIKEIRTTDQQNQASSIPVFRINEERQSTLQAMGFRENAVRRALVRFDNDTQQAANWLLSNGESAAANAPMNDEEIQRIRSARSSAASIPSFSQIRERLSQMGFTREEIELGMIDMQRPLPIPSLPSIPSSSPPSSSSSTSSLPSSSALSSSSIPRPPSNSILPPNPINPPPSASPLSSASSSSSASGSSSIRSSVPDLSPLLDFFPPPDTDSAPHFGMEMDADLHPFHDNDLM